MTNDKLFTTIKDGGSPGSDKVKWAWPKDPAVAHPAKHAKANIFSYERKGCPVDTAWPAWTLRGSQSAVIWLVTRTMCKQHTLCWISCAYGRASGLKYLEHMWLTIWNAKQNWTDVKCRLHASLQMWIEVFYTTWQVESCSRSFELTRGILGIAPCYWYCNVWQPPYHLTKIGKRRLWLPIISFQTLRWCRLATSSGDVLRFFAEIKVFCHHLPRNHPIPSASRIFEVRKKRWPLLRRCKRDQSETGYLAKGEIFRGFGWYFLWYFYGISVICLWYL